MNSIHMKGIRTHNLKDISIDIPKNKLIVITGVSGSGKSSLAFNTIHAESQRRYVRNISLYNRKLLKLIERPNFDSIEGLSPSISIEQNKIWRYYNLTVGALTEIDNYLQLLYNEIGIPYCYIHQIPLYSYDIQQITDSILDMTENTKVAIIAPFANDLEFKDLNHHYNNLLSQGYIRFRINGEILDDTNFSKKLYSESQLYNLEIIIDRFSIKREYKQRILESLEIAASISQNIIKVLELESKNEILFSTKYACPICQNITPKIEPKIFNINYKEGTCDKCNGLGKIQITYPELMIKSDKLSISEGAIRLWDINNIFTKNLLNDLCNYYNFSIFTEYRKLPQSVKDIIMFGSGSVKIPFTYLRADGTKYQKDNIFEGIIPNLQRKISKNVLTENNLKKYFKEETCTYCFGSKFQQQSNNIFIESNKNNFNIYQVLNLNISDCIIWCRGLNIDSNTIVVKTILKEIISRLTIIRDIGLGYLSLSRSVNSLSIGEQQRIRITNQLSSGLNGILYILDEPSIGLHQRDNLMLIKSLKNLRDLGNTVLVIENDRDIIQNADWIIDLGPEGGLNGGEILAYGTYNDIIQNEKSITAKYLKQMQSKQNNSVATELKKRKNINDKVSKLLLYEATGHNLKKIDLSIPVNYFTCITGVSGSGKSTLIIDTLATAISKIKYNTKKEPLSYSKLEGLEYIKDIVVIDQKSIWQNSKSNLATYIGIFDRIRDIFANTNESRKRGYKSSRFSFNIKGGRCENCHGEGIIKVKIDYFSYIYSKCDFCNGNRYNNETLEIKYKGFNINEILNLTIEQSIIFFNNINDIIKKLKPMKDIGLSYMQLGQNANTISRGELQRIKLAIEFSKHDSVKNLYIFDEPTTGLHFRDIELLINVLNKLVDLGNTVVVIEHNVSLIRNADWIIDLGPDGGSDGGYIVYQGDIKELITSKKGYTSKYIN